jgi:purine-binding chemotaxis protein CheW
MSLYTDVVLSSDLDPMPFTMDMNGVFTVIAGGEKLGLPVSCVHTIFRIDRVTPVPGAPHEVMGLVNLRGQIVTAASLRRRLGMADDPREVNPLAIGIEHQGETFALIVDEVGDVLSVGKAERIPAPPHLASARVGLTAAVYKLEDTIISVLDMKVLFEFSRRAAGMERPIRDKSPECEA